MSVQSDAVSEIREYVELFSVDSLFAHPKAGAKFLAAYKQMHALLTWSILVSRGEFCKEEFGFHPEEGIADVSQAYALLTFSLYKPSRMMARSAIENIVRVVVAGVGGQYDVKSVYLLFDNAKASVENDPISTALINKLQTLYGELCLTVHSAHEDHVALRIPFEKVFAYNEEQYQLTVGLLGRTASSVNQLLYSRFNGKLSKLSHKNRDFVLDSLPRLLKRKVQA